MTWWSSTEEQASGNAAGNVTTSAAMRLDDMMHMKLDTTSSDDTIISGLQSLFHTGDLCDVTFVLAGEGGQSSKIPVHAAVLAALSPSFRRYMKRHRQQASNPSAEALKDEDPMRGLLSLVPVAAVPKAADTDTNNNDASGSPATADGNHGNEMPGSTVTESGEVPKDVDATTQRLPAEFQVHGISAPEAFRLLLDYVYHVGTGLPWDYQPSSPIVNHDVLLLARQFELDQLHERAARWLIQGLNTGNVVSRLVTCEEFELRKLREKIMAELASRPQELAQVSGSMEIMRHPRILQDLLVQIASVQQRGAASVAADKEKSPEKVPEKPEEPEKAAPEKNGAAVVAEKPEKRSDKEKLTLEKVVSEKPLDKPPGKRPRKTVAAGA